MDIMIASDIHGSAFYCEKLLEAFSREKCGRLLLLGDLLYHGPRNDLPRDYSPKDVAAMLNRMSEKLLCVRGNCDSEVDQMVLNFPMMADYAAVLIGERAIYLTHGHRFGEDSPPPLAPGSILLCGHTHVPKCAEHGDWVYMNPGSVSIPKEGSRNGYMVLKDDVFLWKDLDGVVFDSYKI